MDDPLDSARARARRHGAELRLVNGVHGLVTHELGNPLQSLVVLVELTRDELQACAPDDPGVSRLSRALESVDRFRSVLVNSSRVRMELFGLGDEQLSQRRWGKTLDVLLPIVEHRLSRVEFHRGTAAIDEHPIAPAFPSSVLLAMLVGVSEQLRATNSRGVRVDLDGALVEGQARLRLALSGPERSTRLDIDADLGDWLEDLLAEAEGCGCAIEAGSLLLWAGA